MEAIVGEKRIAGILIDRGSGVNVINMATCRELGITKWEPCKFWMRMANGSCVRPIGMIRNLEIVVQGHTFTISVVVPYDARSSGELGDDHWGPGRGEVESERERSRLVEKG
jgi:hypothetical protein